ncbi:MAG: ribbon-helix-helix protein, CopG family [Proteobacteria bacterium]|nr:ribbon-helix-helix protein, CopG family [Pseudomonadota bacterium]
MQNQLVTISAQIPASLDKDLTKICESEERSKSYFIKKALEKYLAEKLQDIKDYHEAKKLYEEFKNSGEKAIPYSQIKKKYKL